MHSAEHRFPLTTSYYAHGTPNDTLEDNVESATTNGAQYVTRWRHFHSDFSSEFHILCSEHSTPMSVVNVFSVLTHKYNVI